MFIVPGQRQNRSSDLAPEDSSPPLKPPAPLPMGEEEMDLKVPPPVPPKTYAKMDFDGSPASKPKMATEPVEVIVQVEPKQSNIERVKAVKFHADVKVPIEDDPPPVPVRNHTHQGNDVEETVVFTKKTKYVVAKRVPVATQNPEMGRAKRSKKPVTLEIGVAPVTMEITGKPVAVETSTAQEATGIGSSEVVAIMDENGTQIGEVVPSPLEKEDLGLAASIDKKLNPSPSPSPPPPPPPPPPYDIVVSAITSSATESESQL